MRIRHSLTFKIILGVVLTILPVNLFMIFLAKTSQDVTADTARASMANTARVTLNRLEAGMENINSFIWLMENSDANLKAIAEKPCFRVLCQHKNP